MALQVWAVIQGPVGLHVCLVASDDLRLGRLSLQGGDLLDWTTDHGIQEDAFIQRIEALSTMGYSVLLSNYRRYFKLASYLATFSRESIVIAMGLPSLIVRALYPDVCICWHVWAYALACKRAVTCLCQCLQQMIHLPLNRSA